MHSLGLSRVWAAEMLLLVLATWATPAPSSPVDHHEMVHHEMAHHEVGHHEHMADASSNSGKGGDKSGSTISVGKAAGSCAALGCSVHKTEGHPCQCSFDCASDNTFGWADFTVTCSNVTDACLEHKCSMLHTAKAKDPASTPGGTTAITAEGGSNGRGSNQEILGKCRKAGGN